MTERRSRVGGWPIAIVGMVLVLIAYTLRYTLVPFVFAAMIAFVLEPLIHWSTRRLHGRRWPMAALLSIALVGGAGYAVYWIGTTAFDDVSQVFQSLPQTVHATAQSLIGPHGIAVFGRRYGPQQVATIVMNDAARLFDAAQVLLALKIGFGAAAGFVLTLVLVPYFLASGPRLAAGALWLIPPERRSSVQDVLPELVPLLRRYVTGLVGVVVYTATLAYIALGAVAGVKGAAVLSILVGVLELIPVIGPVTSLLLIGLSASQQPLWTAVALMAFALALRLSIDNLVGPFLLGRAVTIHPVVVIFCFITGAMLFGIIGLVLAVPTAACIKLVLERYYAEPISPEPGRG